MGCIKVNLWREIHPRFITNDKICWQKFLKIILLILIYIFRFFMDIRLEYDCAVFSNYVKKSLS